MEIQQQASQHAFYKKCILQKINSSCQDVDDTISSSLGPFVSRSLLVIKEYIFVQKSHADGSDNHMMVSYNRSTFKHALFPEEIKTRDFIVVDALEGQVFLAVSHSGVGSASLYLSDPTGRFYSLSLPNIHHRATADWFEVDLHQVEGLPATYLANQQLNTSLSESKKVRTYISADKGGSWSLLKPPDNAPCPKKDDCSLVLRLDMGNYNQDWILSHEEAPGLIIAHGQFSQYYDIDPKTLSVFTSKDGGWHWIMAPFKGIFRFNILDQGGILTAIIDRDYGITNNVHYSYDYGKTWPNETFSKDKLMVDGVINEPNINTLLVSIYGHRPRSSPWIMVQLNFSAVFSRKCIDSDYVHWTPSDHDNNTGEQCVLGLEMQYQRRKDDAVCFNGEDYKRPVQNVTCSCTLEDFECDFGYKNLLNKCIKEDWLDDSYLAMDCAFGNSVNKTRGYRKVGSDKCVGGIEKTPDFIPQNISCPLWAPYKLHLIPNITVAATNAPVSFHLTQARGSKANTSYQWNFGDGNMKKVVGFESASRQVHQFSTPGIYVVNVTGINSKGSSTSENVAIHVEKPIRELTLFSASEIKKGYLFTVIVATDVDHTSAFDSLHYVWRFGDEKEEENGRLTWEPQARHMYNSTGDYVITVFAANTVSTKSQQFNVKVYGNGSIVRLSFSENINKIFAYHNFSAVITYQFLDILRRGIAMVVGVDYNRLSIFLFSYNPLKVDLMVVPADPSDISVKQIVATIQDMVKNGTLVVNEPFFNALGSFVVVSAVDIEGDGGHNADSPKVPNYRAVYIALPVVILTALVTVLVLMYYRSRFRSMRHYSVLNQREDTDALLDDEDEPPLDLRSDGRNEHFSRDDSMLDLGTGSHLVMVTGSGGGDSAESC
ncbi:VPS10 domain-containing receptor SorCS1-like [Pomacea canaliculata]|uniref:VPS10 domain-containing receptor SorCS1-like n=1 Tax=Pomacea canaliculata TaxID=400727 RepID=UPI000D72C037|nr:VPS10 domain-containing receptor SorCS1-like [Pomacea canaliculata]